MALPKKHTFDDRTIRSGQLSSAVSFKGKFELSLQLLIRTLRLPTGRMRLLPDFLIIGAQKSGTTTLYKYLIQHPDIHRPWFKEVHFFDRHYAKGLNWYRSHFPLAATKSYRTRFGGEFKTFEASPDYLYYPGSAERAFGVVPKAKLIILLRNPIDRAFSNYNHEVVRGREFLPFEEAIEKEEERVREEREKVKQSKNYYSFIFDHFSYLGRGVYADCLKEWMKFYPLEQMLIINAEQFFAEPARMHQSVLDFLGLEFHRLKKYRTFGAGEYTTMERSLRDRLAHYYRPHNERLFALIGERYHWK